MKKKMQEIRRKLYLNRDGASSSSMKEKGIQYKLNLGVPIHKLREIAEEYSPDSELADALWNEGIRELRILATMIQNASTFKKPNEWAENVQNLELAEQLAMNLTSKLPQAGEWASQWIKSENLYIQILGYLTYIRLFMNNYQLKGEAYSDYFHQIFYALNSNNLSLKNAALNSLKYLGRQSVLNSKNILAECENSVDLNQDFKNELLNELQFEFDNLA